MLENDHILIDFQQWGDVTDQTTDDVTEIQDYKSSGVDAEAGDRLVDWLRTQPPTGLKSNVVSGIGGFSALFRLDLKKYKKPLLVSCTDGVGTKVKWASMTGAPEHIEATGIDLVAMCVNDLITCGGDPLFFLDYYASGKLSLPAAQSLLKGVLKGLKDSDCTLIGGETAEMPGVYQKNDYDCAGFCVGVVDEDDVIDGKDLKVGDVAVGISSSGFHSNGFSLLRKLFEKAGPDEINALMAPTRIYVKFVAELKKNIKIKAMAHITGGGILGNVPRVMPQNTALKIQKWPWPDTFVEAQKRGNLDARQMLETFNCGVGYVVFVDQAHSKKVLETAREFGWAGWTLGVLQKHDGEPEVLL